MHSNKLVKLTVIGTRLFLGLIFFTAGMSKLTQAFPGLMGPVWLEHELAPYGLGMYARFIAWSQVIVGLLVLSQRFATLGAIMLFPLVLNILMVTISLNWRGTPYVVGVFLAMNAGLLVWDYHKLKFLISDNREELASQNLYRSSWKVDALWSLAIGLILASVPIIATRSAVGYFMVILGLLTLIFCQLGAKMKLKTHS